MIRKAFIVALIVSVTTPGAAQDTKFSGQCTDYKKAGKEACIATQWCRWANVKPIKFPNGLSSKASGYCAFKRGHKAGWAAQAAQSSADVTQ